MLRSQRVRNVASKLAKPEALLPIMLIEAGVIGGRTYQAHKRGGWIESRERITEEVTTSIVWFAGIKTMNKILDKVIKGFKYKDIEVDVGLDAIRDPLKFALKGKEHIKDTLTKLKLGKILLAAATGIFLCGNAIPKLNQAITKEMTIEKGKNNTNSHDNRNNFNKIPERDFIAFSKKVSMQEFMNATKNSPNKKSVSFTNGKAFGEIFRYAAHNIENNNIWNLLTVDLGVWTGRAANARNKDERNEIIFRELASSYFYLFATQHIYKALTKKFDRLGGANTDIDSNCAYSINKKITSRLFANKAADHKIPVTEFNEFVEGKPLTANYNKIKAELPNDDIVQVSKLKELVQKHVLNTEEINIINTDAVSKRVNSQETILSNIEKLINHMRPDGSSKKVMTISEAKSCLKSGLINDAEFTKEIINVATENKFQNSQKFIPYKTIDSIKNNIKQYAKSIAKIEKETQSITQHILDKAMARNTATKLGYIGTGLAVSLLFMSTIIPKAQYYITKLRTGKDEFPGARGLELKDNH